LVAPLLGLSNPPTGRAGKNGTKQPDGGGGEYSTLERLSTPTKHGRLRRVILEVYATTAHSVVFPRSQQQLLGHGKIRYATMARWIPYLMVTVSHLPAGPRPGVLISRLRMCVMSCLAGCVLSPRDDGTVCRWWLVCGGRRWAPRRAPWRLVAGSLGRRGSLSERRRRAPRL
jgi:hypothetical protein